MKKLGLGSRVARLLRQAFVARHTTVLYSFGDKSTGKPTVYPPRSIHRSTQGLESDEQLSGPRQNIRTRDGIALVFISSRPYRMGRVAC